MKASENFRINYSEKALASTSTFGLCEGKLFSAEDMVNALFPAA